MALSSLPLPINKVIVKYKPYFRNKSSLLAKARKGLSPLAVFEFMQLSRLSDIDVEWALNKNLKTIQNYKKNKTELDAVTSEKLLILFSLYDKGIEIFGSIEDFNNWLMRPSYGLGNETPKKNFDTVTGIEQINDELVRIEYGDLA